MDKYCGEAGYTCGRTRINSIKTAKRQLSGQVSCLLARVGFMKRDEHTKRGCISKNEGVLETEVTLARGDFGDVAFADLTGAGVFDVFHFSFDDFFA